MSHLGSFSPEALEAFQNAVAGDSPEFAEGEIYDFTRCVRADGSHYGTGGTCRKGTETGEKEKSWSPPTGKKRPPENPTAAQITAMSNDELWDGKATYKPGTAGHQAYKNEIERRRQKDENLKKREVEPKAQGAKGNIPVLTKEDMGRMSVDQLKAVKKAMDERAFGKDSAPLSNTLLQAMSDQNKRINEELARRGGGGSKGETRVNLEKAHSVFKAAKTKEEEARKALKTDKSPEAVQRHREAYQAMSKAEQLYNKADDDHMASLRAAAKQKK